MNRWKKIVFLIVCLSLAPVLQKGSAETLKVSVALPETNPLFTAVCQILDEMAILAGPNIRIQTIYLPHRRAIRNLESGLIDGDFGRTKAVYQDSPHVVVVPEYIIEVDYHAFSKQQIKITGWASIDSLKVVVLFGHRFLESRLKGRAGEVFYVADVEAAFEMLDQDRADVHVVEVLMGQRVYLDRDYAARGIRLLHPRIDAVPLYLVLNKKHRDKVGSFAQAIKAMNQAGRILQIVQSVR